MYCVLNRFVFSAFTYLHVPSHDCVEGKRDIEEVQACGSALRCGYLHFLLALPNVKLKSVLTPKFRHQYEKYLVNQVLQQRQQACSLVAISLLLPLSMCPSWSRRCTSRRSSLASTMSFFHIRRLSSDGTWRN